MRRDAVIRWAGLVAVALVACGDPGPVDLSGMPASAITPPPASTTPPLDDGPPNADAGLASEAGQGGGSAGPDAAAHVDGSVSTPPPSDAGVAPAPAGAGIPCAVASLLAAKCVGCHADPPVNGSLSGLVTLSDLMATSKEDATKNEAQLSLARMKNAASPMPPASVGNAATAAEIQAFQAWVDGGYQGSCSDAGAPPPPPTNVFTGAPAFVSVISASSHNAGKNCMNGCHNHGFTFAGTLTDGKGNAVVGAEVRLVDAKGVAISVHTGPTGNFHSTTAFTAPAHVGARDATTTVTMVTPLQSTNGGCNGCHATGGTTAPIHLP